MSSANVYSRPDSIIAALFPEYRQRACRYANWLIGNESDAEEIVQEAFVRLARRERNGKPVEDEKRFAGLLFTTVRNLSIDLLRKHGRQRQVSLTTINEPFADKCDDGSAQQLDRQITQLMEELPKNWAEALKLKVTGDLTYDEIAAVLKCTRAQVRTWIFRARKQLARELTKRGWMEDRT